MSAEPTMTCTVCRATEVVHPDGRGYPPDIARRRLIKRCKSAGHVCDPVYQAGFIVGTSDKYAFRQARGAATLPVDSPPSEDLVRRGR